MNPEQQEPIGSDPATEAIIKNGIDSNEKLNEVAGNTAAAAMKTDEITKNQEAQIVQSQENTDSLKEPLDQIAKNTEPKDVQKVEITGRQEDDSDDNFNENEAGKALWGMLRGPKGVKGDSIKGDKGDTGADSKVVGPKGAKGDSVKGDKGDKGDSVKGDKGDTGAASEVAGPKGDVGPKGEAGKNADTKSLVKETETIVREKIGEEVSKRLDINMQSMERRISASKSYSTGDLTDTKEATPGQAMIKQADGTWYPGTAGGGAVEGVDILSTGVPVGRVLQADGDGTSSFVALTGGGNAQTADPLSQFAATTLAQLNSVISDATLGDAGDFATAAQGSKADSAQQPPSEGAFVDGDKTKLDTYSEANQTANNAKVTYPSADATKVGHITVTQAVNLDTMESDIANKANTADLATVATTGDYDDLSNKPDLSAFDNISEHANVGAFPATGAADKFYLAQDTGILYRWTGSAYSIISAQLALGETSSTAYRGDRGATAFSHVSATDNPHSVSKAQVGLGSVPNTDFTSTVDANTAKVSYTDAAKVAGIEAGAQVTNTARVRTAGAVMDDEITNLAQVKAFDSTDYAAALGTDDNYVTDAEKTVIGNTSGTNTGDQDLSGLAPIANPTFTGEVGIGGVNVSETELGILEGATLTTAELNYVDGVTSSIQTQIDATVKTTGAQSVAGVKTFSAFPVTPSSDPTTDYQVATKKYVDDNAGGAPETISFGAINGAGNSNMRMVYQDSLNVIMYNATTLNYMNAVDPEGGESRAVSSDLSGVSTLASGIVVLGDYIYLNAKVSDSPDVQKVLRYSRTDLASGSTDMSFSGSTVMVDSENQPHMTSDGTNFYFMYDAGNSSNTYEVAKYTVSGTTFTYVSTITLGSAALECIVAFANGDFIGIDGGNVLRKYNSSGVQQYVGGAQVTRDSQIMNTLDSLYLTTAGDTNTWRKTPK